MATTTQQPPVGGLRQFAGAQPAGGAPGQKPQGKQPKPLGERENVNAGHMVPDPAGFDPSADTSGFTGWSDVTPHVAGGAVQIVGGVRPPESGTNDAAEAESGEGSKA